MAFFALEHSFHAEQLARAKKGVAFVDTNGRLYANWIERLAVMAEMGRFRGGRGGSWSPFLLVGRASALELDLFIAAHRQYERPATHEVRVWKLSRARSTSF